jgi:outer membrane receptor protein involved in Fe transport
VGLASPTKLNPGDADVSFNQEDSLPSLGFVITPVGKTTLRVSYSETVARQTFKELSPIEQQEYLGADIFIGNPDLKMSALRNYDVRLDYTPFKDGLFSFSWFRKDVVDPIEYVQRRTTSYGFTQPINYPSGKIIGYEFEGRQNVGHFWEGLNGFSLGGNVTFLDSMVLLPGEEADLFEIPSIKVSMKRRDMSNTPERLYNIFLTYELERLGTDIGIFYSVRGDTLVAGAGQDVNNFLPSVYEKEYGTLNLSLSQKVGKSGKLMFQIKNLTNPRIQEVYRSEVLHDDIVKTSYKKGIDYSLSIGFAW